MDYKIFCDLDGVLADFDEGVKDVTGKMPHQLGKKEMWTQLARSNDFFYNLPFMSDAPQLWKYIEQHNPIILTGLPFGKWAKPQKIRWVGENLGWGINVITTVGQTAKAEYSGPGHILIDDRDKVKPYWEEAGGIFIHHKSAEQSIKELEQIVI